MFIEFFVAKRPYLKEIWNTIQSIALCMLKYHKHSFKKIQHAFLFTFPVWEIMSWIFLKSSNSNLFFIRPIRIRKFTWITINVPNYFFWMYLRFFRNTCGKQFPPFLRAESKLITAKQVWLDSTLGISSL